MDQANPKRKLSDEGSSQQNMPINICLDDQGNPLDKDIEEESVEVMQIEELIFENVNCEDTGNIDDLDISCTITIEEDPIGVGSTIDLENVEEIQTEEIIFENVNNEDIHNFDDSDISCTITIKLKEDPSSVESIIDLQNAEEMQTEETIFEDVNNEDIQNIDDLDISCTVTIKLEDDPNSVESTMESQNIIGTDDITNLYVCKFCDFKTKNQCSLTDHSYEHDDDGTCVAAAGDESPPDTGRFVCSECGYVYTQKSHLEKHVVHHEREKELLCSLCSFKALNATCFTNHMMTHIASQRASCSRAPASNVNTYNSRKTYVCYACKFESKQKKEVSRHIKIHTKPFLCNLCGRRFSNTSLLDDHKKLHMGIKPYECERCDYKTKYKNSLYVHKLRHDGERPYKCEHCEFRCADKYYLKTHNRLHTDEQFVCRYCEHKSITKSSLAVHMRLHTGELPFACHMCSFKTNTKQKLTTHLDQHKSLIIYQSRRCIYRACNDVCLPFNPQFLDVPGAGEEPVAQEGPRTYSRAHEGEKPLKCQYCEYRCVYQSSLAQHERIHTTSVISIVMVD